MGRRRVTKRQAYSEFTSDAAWREALTEWLSGRCGVPGCLSVTVQADHIIPRSQGGLSDLYNGWLICPAHHESKTSGVLMIDPAWLRPEHHAYLAGHGWVEWSHIDPGFPGEWLPVGRGWRHFLGLPVTATPSDAPIG